MRLRWVLFWAVTALFWAILGTSIYWEVCRQQKIARLIAHGHEQLSELNDKIRRTRDRIEFYRSAEGQAWIARDRLNIVFPGERIYRIEIPGANLSAEKK